MNLLALESNIPQQIVCKLIFTSTNVFLNYFLAITFSGVENAIAEELPSV
jgi:hypothetical protein